MHLLDVHYDLWCLSVSCAVTSPPNSWKAFELLRARGEEEGSSANEAGLLSDAFVQQCHAMRCN